mmetsp:Transcript_103836/g.180398  ORF Transcript_103836/g.180398 Transcript_103836/m.180398 type:complete len:414 (+) Transcript_103836:62-1303(+)
MRAFLLALASLGFASDGRRVRMANEETESRSHGQPSISAPSSHAAESQLHALAEFLFALDPAAAWQAPNLGNGGSLSLQTHSSHHAASSPSIRSSRHGQSSFGAGVNGRGQALPASRATRTGNAPQMIWASAFSELKTEDSRDTASPAGLTCRLSLNVGRESGTFMPAEWSASGARLFLPVSVTFSQEPVGNEVDRERLLGPREKWHRLVVNGDATFVSSRGLEHVAVNDGAWSVTPSGHESGELLVRFYLDFPNGAVRNDVKLPAGRVFFSSGAWPQAELSAAREKVAAMEEQVAALRKEFEEKATFLKNGSALQRAKALRTGTAIYDQLVLREESLEYMKSGLPNSKGAMEVPNSMLHLNKDGGLSIKRRGPARRLFAEEYHVIGTFSFNDLVSSHPQIEHETKQLSASTA